MSENERPSEQNNSSSQPHGRGRPNAAIQVEMEQEVRHYFSMGITSPQLIAKLTKHDVKTVRSILNKLAAIKREINDRGYMEECKVRIESSTIAFDGLILKLNGLLDSQIKRLATLENEFAIDSTCDQIRRTTDTIGKLIALKLAIANSPTADISIMKLAKGVFEKLGSPMAN